MFPLAQLPTVMMTAALSLAPPAGDWIPASMDGDCSGTDVHFSDLRRGFATCALDRAMVTDDGGLTWSVFPTQLQQSLVFAFAASADVLFAARKGLYVSIDRGAHWDEIGGLSANFGSVFDVHFKADRNLVAIQGGELRFSDNGGAAWQSAYSAQFPEAFDELDFPPRQLPADGIGYATGGTTNEAGSVGSVLRTDDGGHHWTALAFTHGQITAADFFDASSGVVATLSGHVYTTADGGMNWTPAGAMPDDAILMDLVHRHPMHWIGVSLQGCLYETFDGGTSWNASYCDPGQRGLIALTLSGGAAVAVGNDGLALFENRIFASGFD
jgi:photosystem II stability/assembly factor-like uncharacterized protein